MAALSLGCCTPELLGGEESFHLNDLHNITSKPQISNSTPRDSDSPDMVKDMGRSLVCVHVCVLCLHVCAHARVGYKLTYLSFPKHLSFSKLYIIIGASMHLCMGGCMCACLYEAWRAGNMNVDKRITLCSWFSFSAVLFSGPNAG